MQINAYAISDQGEVREHNEDAYGVFNLEKFYVLADGVGGRQAGKVAALETVNQLFYRLQLILRQIENCEEEEILNLLQLNVTETNHVVIKKGDRHENLKGMAAAFCFAFIHEKTMYVSHYGDSRIYQIRRGRIRALTKDHTLAQELEDAQKAVTSIRQKNTLTKAIGLKETHKATVGVHLLEEGDLYLLCSDGVTEKLSEELLLKYLSQDKKPALLLKEIILAARNLGAKDNATAILLKID